MQEAKYGKDRSSEVEHNVGSSQVQSPACPVKGSQAESDLREGSLRNLGEFPPVGINSDDPAGLGVWLSMLELCSVDEHSRLDRQKVPGLVPGLRFSGGVEDLRLKLWMSAACWNEPIRTIGMDAASVQASIIS